MWVRQKQHLTEKAFIMSLQAMSHVVHTSTMAHLQDIMLITTHTSQRHYSLSWQLLIFWFNLSNANLVFMK